jgi:hypothetical protein
LHAQSRSAPPAERLKGSNPALGEQGDGMWQAHGMDDVPPAFGPDELALVAEGCSRSGVVWVKPPGAERHRLVWHVWHGGAVLVVCGGGEQELPPLSGVVEVVVPSKETRARLATVLMRARTLAPGTREWGEAVTVLAAKRLNERDPAEQRDRWARSATVVRLEPVRIEHSGRGTPDAPSGAVRPPADGSTTGRRPWHWRGRAAARRAGGRRQDADGEGANGLQEDPDAGRRYGARYPTVQ